MILRKERLLPLSKNRTANLSIVFSICHSKILSASSGLLVWTRDCVLSRFVLVQRCKMSMTLKRHINGQVVPIRLSLIDALHGAPPLRRKKKGEILVRSLLSHCYNHFMLGFVPRLGLRLQTATYMTEPRVPPSLILWTPETEKELHHYICRPKTNDARLIEILSSTCYDQVCYRQPCCSPSRHSLSYDQIYHREPSCSPSRHSLGYDRACSRHYNHDSSRPSNYYHYSASSFDHCCH